MRHLKVDGGRGNRHAQGLARDAAVGRRVSLGVTGASGEEMTGINR